MVHKTVYEGLIGPIDFENHEEWPDEKLGKYLIAARLGAEAESRGISPSKIPKALAEQLVKKIAAQEAAEVANIPLEKALQLAARGNVAKAGNIFREWMLERASIVAAFDEAITGRRKQQVRAKKPRPKKAATARGTTIAAMSQWRSEERTLPEFLAAADAGSIPGITVKPAGARGVERFTVECDDVHTTAPPVAHSTLEEWWRAAKK